jgi:DNA primase
MSATSIDKISLLTRSFGSIEVCRDDTNVTALCPICAKQGSSKKKLSIRLDDGRYHCWVCGSKGRSVIQLIKKYHPSFVDEAKKYFKIKGKGFDLFGEEEAIESPEERVEVPENFRLLGTLLDSKNPDVRATIQYCASRGLGLRDLWYYKLGISNEARFNRRVIIPSFDDAGVINFYSGRSIDKVRRMKYLNASIQKTKIIFNEINIDWSKELALVEGPFDLMKCNENSTCLLGSQLSRESKLFRQIVRNQTPVVLALDQDAIQKTHKIAAELSSFGVQVKLADIPKDKDVGDMTHEEFVTIRKRAKEWNSDFRLYTMIASIKSGSLI